MKRKPLGRGLSSLLGEQAVDDSLAQGTGAQKAEDSQSYRQVAIGDIIPNPQQPRQYFDEDKLRELAQSLKTSGILQPLLVRANPKGQGYELVAGERRWRAAQIAGLHQVPVVVKDLDNAKVLELALVENLQRDDLNPIESAEAFDRLVKEFHYSHEELAQYLGKSRSALTNELRLLTLSKNIKDWIRSGKLSSAHGRNLVGVAKGEELALKVMAEQWSVRRLEREVKSWKGGDAEAVPPTKKTKSAGIMDWEKKLTKELGMEVMIEVKKGNRGKVVLLFDGQEDLAKIIKRLYGKLS